MQSGFLASCKRKVCYHFVLVFEGKPNGVLFIQPHLLSVSISCEEKGNIMIENITVEMPSSRSAFDNAILHGGRAGTMMCTSSCKSNHPHLGTRPALHKEKNCSLCVRIDTSIYRFTGYRFTFIVRFPA